MEKKNRENASKLSLHLKQFAMAGCVAMLAACGGGGETPGSDPLMFTLGVEVSGLTRESGNALILVNNGGDDLPIFADGPHRFLRPIEYQTDYNVTVKTQPDNVICSVTNGAGYEVTAEIPTIMVRCSAASLAHTIGGTVSQLAANSQIVLRKGDELLPISSNGKYSFNKKVADKGGYIVSIATPADGQKCDVQNWSRTNVTSNISDVNVVCSSKENTFTVGGNVVGLTSGKLVLRNNGVDPLEVTKNDAFQFNTPIASGSFYNVTVEDPVGQTCSVENRSGENVKANVSNILVKCSAKATSFSISGKVTGLDDGASITLKNNGDNATTVEGNGRFEFAVPVSGPYDVTIDIPPALQNCSVINKQGHATSNVTDVTVRCSPPEVNIISNFPLSLPEPYNVPLFNNADYYPVGLMELDGELLGTTTLSVVPNTELNNTTGYIFKKPLTGPMSFIHMFAGSGDSTGPIFRWPAFPTGIMKAKCDPNIANVYCIFGTTYLGGPNFIGALYTLNLSDNSVKFDTNASVEAPVADLVQDEVTGNFYGVEYGNPNVAGKTQGGTVFMRTPQGVVTSLHTFEALDGNGANVSGFLPNGRLTLLGDTLFGAAEMGGANGRGTIFKIKLTDPKKFTVIHNFETATSANFPAHPFTEGFKGSGPFFDPYASPYSGLTKVSDGKLYGVAKYGGANGAGRIYKITATEPHVFTTHYEFTKSNGYPVFELLELNGKLYGVTQGDNSATNKGSIFRIALQDGSPLEILHAFGGTTANGDANGPSTRLGLSSDGSSVFGGTRYGGVNNKGAIYRFGRN